MNWMRNETEDKAKSPSALLRFIFRHCDVLICTPHSSRLARLASGPFCFAVHFMTFRVIINCAIQSSGMFSSQQAQQKLVISYANVISSEARNLIRHTILSAHHKISPCGRNDQKGTGNLLRNPRFDMPPTLDILGHFRHYFYSISLQILRY
jgi:hypothetical protein